jgi:hypothetical protein
MKGILFKTGGDYLLKDIDGKTLAITNGVTEGKKLSKQNCDEIFGVVVDVEKVACKEIKIHIDQYNIIHTKATEKNASPCTPSNEGGCVGANLYNQAKGFIRGFNKAMELNKDKVFTLRDVKQVIFNFANYDRKTISELDRMDMAIASIQQPTEIEVGIEMKKIIDETKVIGSVKNIKGSGDIITTYKSEPKLDPDGCLILKLV